MASAATLRRCALPAAAALAAQQQHARTEGSLLQWRSSRVAPQSVDGRPVADVREGGGAVSRLYGVSRRGYAPYDRSKRNQDALRVLKDERTDTQAILVLDGHGEYGEEVSRRFADKFLEAVTKHPFWATNIERACREELARLEGEILADSSIDCAFSGTTVAFAAVRRNQVFWCNVGDSRITLGVLCDGVVRASAQIKFRGASHAIDAVPTHWLISAQVGDHAVGVCRHGAHVPRGLLTRLRLRQGRDRGRREDCSHGEHGDGHPAGGDRRRHRHPDLQGPGVR